MYIGLYICHWPNRLTKYQQRQLKNPCRSSTFPYTFQHFKFGHVLFNNIKCHNLLTYMTHCTLTGHLSTPCSFRVGPPFAISELAEFFILNSQKYSILSLEHHFPAFILNSTRCWKNEMIQTL